MSSDSLPERLQSDGYATFPAALYRAHLQAKGVLDQLPQLLESFSRLTPDKFMGDGGTYRNRAYSRFVYRWNSHSPTLEPLEGHSIFQTLEDNSLNGGVLRTYAPLAAEVNDSALLRELVLEDAKHAMSCDPSLRESAVQVGVHQVRIVARSQSLGLPTPEGIHRDSERFTFQHFCQRTNIEGGEFRAYDQQKRPLFSWLQTESLDTVMFEGTTWHSATPVACQDPSKEGYRDIFLIDFDRLSP